MYWEKLSFRFSGVLWCYTSKSILIKIFFSLTLINVYFQWIKHLNLGSFLTYVSYDFRKQSPRDIH